MIKSTLYISLVFALYFDSVYFVSAYVPPNATITPYCTGGFEASIPADEGITLFAFHGQLDEEFNGPQAGTWSRDIDTVKNGKFTFVDKTAALSYGKKIHFWTTVEYKGKHYHQTNGLYVADVCSFRLS